MQFSLQHLSTTEEYPVCIMTALLVTWMGFSSQHSTSVLEVERTLLCLRTFWFFRMFGRFEVQFWAKLFDFEDFVTLWTIFFINNVRRTVWFMVKLGRFQVWFWEKIRYSEGLKFNLSKFKFQYFGVRSTSFHLLVLLALD